MNKQLLQKYATLAIKVGCGLKKGQDIIINAPVQTSDFNRLLVEQAYKLGARKVHMEYRDDLIKLQDLKYQDIKILTTIPKYISDRRAVPIQNGACILNVISDIPDVFKSINSNKLKLVSQANEKANHIYREYQGRNQTKWSIVAYPNTTWAKKVFPKYKTEMAYAKLEKAILDACYVSTTNDPIKAWVHHNKLTHDRVNTMNKYHFKTLHFWNDLGTNITFDLPPKHNWAGGQELSTKGEPFNPNIPTEEIFCMPSKFGINGKVVTTKPLNYLGNLISQFTLTFKNGKVVKYTAKDHLPTLKSLIEYDEGSCYAGEIAIVEHYSPISLSGVLFYETLFDENASCHIALGRAYAMNLVGGTKMSKEQLAKNGANYSGTHVDFMFGSKNMNIDGITKNAKVINIYKNGKFTFKK